MINKVTIIRYLAAKKVIVGMLESLPVLRTSDVITATMASDRLSSQDKEKMDFLCRIIGHEGARQ